MSTVTRAGAMTHIGHLLDQVDEEVVITRRAAGRPHYAGRETRATRQSLAQFPRQMPGWRKPCAELLRELRDEGL